MMIDDFLKKHELKVIFSSELKVDQETFVKKMKKVTDINFRTIFFLVADNFGSILFIMGKYKNIIFVYAKFSRNIFHSIRFSRALVC